MKSILSSLLFVCLVGGLLSCSSGYCRRYESSNKRTAEESQLVESLGPIEETAFVYKYDGSLQCGKMGIARNGINETEMKNELEGIPILSMKKGHDGKLHIQRCGATTGRINIYEIPKKLLGNALQRGFSRLDNGEAPTNKDDKTN